MNKHHSIRFCGLHMLVRVFGLFAISFLSGCSSDPDLFSDQRPDETPTYQAAFRLTVSDTAGGERTKTTPDGDYDRGAGYENYIDIEHKDFCFLFFDAENKYLESMKVTSVLPVEQTATSKTYEVLGSVEPTIKDRPVKIVVLANWEHQYPTQEQLQKGVATIDDLCDKTFDFSPEPLSDTHTIPLYGVKYFESPLTWDSNNFSYLGTIHMLRAMAKIEVRPADGTVITEATMTRVNDKGLAAPRHVYSQDDYVKGNYKDDYLNGVHLPENLTVKENVSLQKQPDGSYIIYVPEYDNTSSSAVKSTIHLKFGSGYEADLEFKFYDNEAATAAGKNLNDPFDIARNNWYLYTVGESVFVVTIMPMRDVDLDMDFGFDDLFPKKFK